VCNLTGITPPEPGTPLPATLSESLSVELKSWLDPLRPEHRAVIVKALVALRNRDGGALYVGFRDDGKSR